MPIPQSQNISVSLADGLNTGDEPKMAGRGMLQLENAVLEEPGVLKKRLGTVKLDAADTHDEEWMATFRDTPVLIGDALKFYKGSSPTAGEFEPVKERLNLWDVATQDIAMGEQYSICADVAKLGDVVVVTRLTGDVGELPSLIASTYSYESRARLDVSTIVSSSANTANARPVIIGSTLYIFYVNSSRYVAYRTVDADGIISSESTVDATVQITATGDGGQTFIDVAVFDAGDSVAIGYVNTSDEPAVAVFDGAYVATLAFGSEYANFVSVCRMRDDLAVLVWGDNNATPSVLKAGGVDELGNNDMTKVTLHTCSDNAYHLYHSAGIREDDTNAQIFYEEWDGTKYSIVWSVTVQDNSGTGAVGVAAAEFCHDSFLASKPFDTSSYASSAFHLWVHFPGHDTTDGTITVRTGQKTLFLLDNNAKTVAKALYTESSVVFNSAPSVVVDTGSATWLVAAGIWKRLSASLLSGRTAVGLLSFARQSAQPPTDESLSHLHIGSAVPWEFDGFNVVEQGFNTYPEGLTVTLKTGSVNPLLATKAYGYCATYERWGDRGERHISAPSAIVDVTVGGSDQAADITVPLLQHSQLDEYLVVLHRTVGNGSLYYRLKEVSVAPNSANEVTIEDDTIQDTALPALEQIYAPPLAAAIKHVAPPSYRVSAVWQNRLFYVPRREEESVVQYSKQFIRREEVAHTDVFRFNVDTAGGRMTALMGMDDKLIIFKENSCLYTYGQPLDENGMGNNYQRPALLNSSIGCVNQHSIVRVPMGILFQAHDGLKLLTHQLKIESVGDAVRQQTEYDALTISKALDVPEKSRAIFLTSDGDALVFFYKFGVWSTFTAHTASGGCVAGGLLYFKVDADDLVRVEDRSTFADDTAKISLDVITPWYHLFDTLGAGRVREFEILGDNISAHLLEIEEAFDLEPVWQPAQLFNSRSIGVYWGRDAQFEMDGDTSYQHRAYIIRARTTRPKCTAIRLRIRDTPEAATEGYSLSQLNFRISPRRGLKRLGAERKL